VKARVRVEACRAPDGGVRFPVLRSEPPLSARVAAGELWLVGTAAGPLGRDRVEVSVEVGPGAALGVRSAAATVALAAASDEGSILHVDASVGPGGLLRWAPEPLVPTGRCRHRSAARVQLADGARLVWRDELVAGRTDEEPGSCAVSLLVDGPSGPVLRHELRIGPDAPGWAEGAVLAGARAIGTLVVVGVPGLPTCASRLAGGAGIQPLAAGGVLVTALGSGAATVRSALDEAVALLLGA
jgi:urease accessory protein